MTQRLFDTTFLVAAPFWALMILAPRWRRTRAIVASPLICLPPLLIYAALVLPAFADFSAALANPTLPALQELLSSAPGTAATWAHFIAFDLFLGRWIFFDSRDRRINPMVISGLLVFTIIFAPLGVLIYLLIRFIRKPPPESGTSPLPEARWKF
ncbi:ABA4-like family protein [Nocardia sp. NPDC024068]|uniref:ABA4-like family protein n=1 Tax=Nocardia sp. NPDC024068 TaxID=3157197 RepID=UPI00340373C1